VDVGSRPSGRERFMKWFKTLEGREKGVYVLLREGFP
jgi:hypothetical protein